MTSKQPLGSAHGRFQPLHKGHLEYLLASKELCEFLYVGITQFDVSSLCESPADTHRQHAVNNPLTYFERLEMITEGLLDAGLHRSEFSVIPFPIEQPSSLYNYLPITVPVFTTICEPWNRYKVKILEEAGYEVTVLWEREKKLYEGVQVRWEILNGIPDWKERVPSATVRAVERYNIRERLKLLSGVSNT